MAALNRKSAQDATDAIKINSVAPESTPKKIREGTLPMKSSSVSSSSKTVGGSSKSAGSRGSRSRPPLAGTQNSSPSPRSGL